MSLMVMVALLASSRMLSSTKPKPAPCTTDNSWSSMACISALARELAPSSVRPSSTRAFISAPGGRGAQAGVLPGNAVERLVKVDIDRRNHIAVGVFVLWHVHKGAFEGGHKAVAVHVAPGHILG